MKKYQKYLLFLPPKRRNLPLSHKWEENDCIFMLICYNSSMGSQKSAENNFYFVYPKNGTIFKEVPDSIGLY